MNCKLVLPNKHFNVYAIQPCTLHGQTALAIQAGVFLPKENFCKPFQLLFIVLGIYNFGRAEEEQL